MEVKQMKKNTNKARVPSTREESIKMIIRRFITSNNHTIKLALYPYEIPKLEEEHKELVVDKGKEILHPANELSIFTISKRS